MKKELNVTDKRHNDDHQVFTASPVMPVGIFLAGIFLSNTVHLLTI